MFDLAIDDAGVARIRLDRPESRNAVPVAGWHQLADRVAEAAGARALVLQAGAPGTFCAGADLKELAGLAEAPERRAPFEAAMARAFGAVADFAAPSLAVIDGGCFGAGVALAMACDIRIASIRARFAIPPARLGILYPVADVARLVRLVGRSQATRLLAGGAAIDGAEAARIGLATILAEDPRGAGATLASEIAANPPAIVATLCAMIRTPDQVPADAFVEALGGEPFRRALAARR